LHYLESQLNALIITSMDLPNGYTRRDLLHAIRAMEGYENVPVIAMATRDRCEDRDDVMRQGFDAYFHKPLDLLTLRQTVQRLLRVGSTSLVSSMKGKE
jgi:CheY-like chemotaxis protein